MKTIPEDKSIDLSSAPQSSPSSPKSEAEAKAKIKFFEEPPPQLAQPEPEPTPKERVPTTDEFRKKFLSVLLIIKSIKVDAFVDLDEEVSKLFFELINESEVLPHESISDLVADVKNSRILWMVIVCLELKKSGKHLTYSKEDLEKNKPLQDVLQNEDFSLKDWLLKKIDSYRDVDAGVTILQTVVNRNLRQIVERNIPTQQACCCCCLL